MEERGAQAIHAHKGRRNVKSGCSTCKIRKVKCDEGFPACRRCISAGRVCSGYGVWGGGGNIYGHRQQSDGSGSANLKLPLAPISIVATSTEEKQYFDWFYCRTARKIPGLFVLTFWDTLIFQASVNDPAVLHAVLTLSSVHKETIGDGDNQEQQFVLKHYTKAIGYLRPHFLNKDESSIRITLITCVVFVCLEILRGNFKTAQNHLRNGLNVLREVQSSSDVNDDGLVLLRPSRNSIDDWIAGAFCRLHVQVILFDQTYDHPWSILLKCSESEPSVQTYWSLNEAWKQLERLLNKTFYLARQARQQQIPDFSCSSSLFERQQHIKADLAQWLNTYEALRKLHGDSHTYAYPLLHAYHKMASIMADTCLMPNDESIFDCHTEQFISLIEQMILLRKLAESRAEPDYHTQTSKSSVDIGWIPPLYYTALKCRVHRVRLQAIRLIESHSHREGFWDSKIAACVARHVMEVEERDFYEDNDATDDFLLFSSPVESHLSLQILPQSYRLLDVKVELPDGPKDSVLLFYRQKHSTGNWRMVSEEYDSVSQCWTDSKTGNETAMCFYETIRII